MAIAERYARKVPENEHEAPLLVVHIPIIMFSIRTPQRNEFYAYHVVTMDSSAFEQAFAYKK